MCELEKMLEPKEVRCIAKLLSLLNGLIRIPQGAQKLMSNVVRQ